MNNLVEFALRKAETEEEYDQITSIMDHILDLPDGDDNEYVTQLWNVLQDLVNDYEEKQEAEAEEEGEKELATESSNPDTPTENTEEDKIVEDEVNPSKVAFRGKKPIKSE